MFGDVAMGIPKSLFEYHLDQRKDSRAARLPRRGPGLHGQLHHERRRPDPGGHRRRRRRREIAERSQNETLRQRA